MGKENFTGSLSWRQKVINTAFAFSTVINLNLPPPSPEEVCQNAITTSQIELERAPLLGFTFNLNEAAYVGLEPKFALETLLKMGFDQVRIPIYPNQPTDQMVKELTWEVDLAESYHTDVILDVGRKNPGYPEEYLPQNAVQETLEKAEAALEAVGRKDIVKIIQVSNEPYLSAPGLPPESPELLKDMVTLIRPFGKPLLFTHLADPMHLATDAFERTITAGDLGGIDVYMETEVGHSSCVVYSEQLHKLNELAKQAGKPLMVTELQTLPWPEQIPIPLPTGSVLYLPLPFQQSLRPGEIDRLYRMVLMNTDAESVHFWEMTKVLAQDLDGNTAPMTVVKRIIAQDHLTRQRLEEEQAAKQGTIIAFPDEQWFHPATNTGR